MTYNPRLENSLVTTHAGDVSIGGSTLYLKPIATPPGPNIKGAWTEIFSALPFDVQYLSLDFQISGNAFFYVDIAIGPSGSEVIVLPNFVVTRSAGGVPNVDYTIPVPLAIPKGTRLAMRYQHQTGGSNLFRVKVHPIAAGFMAMQSPSLYEGWGQDPSLTWGANVVTGAAHTKGAYTQLVAATAFDVRWLFISVQSIQSARHLCFDLAIGAASAEVPFIEDVQFTNEQNGQIYGSLPFCIPKGSRVSARAAADTAGSTPQISAWGGGC